MHTSFRNGFEKNAMTRGFIAKRVASKFQKNRPGLAEKLKNRFGGAVTEAMESKTPVLPGSSQHHDTLMTLRNRHLPVSEMKGPDEAKLIAQGLRR